MIRAGVAGQVNFMKFTTLAREAVEGPRAAQRQVSGFSTWSHAPEH
jgi:hypothetical protein